VVDSIDQAKFEAGDLLIPMGEGVLDWDGVTELSDIVSTDQDRGTGLTVFKSLGIAIEDVAVARHVFEKAVRLGLGEATSFGEGQA
jgi:ornithine cyclodeaminase/alanine dehydrogenase-like protein (mu-crystallin family)